MNRDGYRDQIVNHDVGVSLHSKTHPLFMKMCKDTSSGTDAFICSVEAAPEPMCVP